MVTIIDYGLGNLRAFANIYKQVNIPFQFAQKVSDLNTATKLILPGVGAFDHAMEQFDRSGMRHMVEELVLEKKVPVIGVCVGMQMMAKSSEEGTRPGLGWIDATVKKFDPQTITFATRLPHMGWNDVIPANNNELFKGLESDAKFYFLHSYYFSCNNATESIATTVYGNNFTSAVKYNNIYGVQFHPEKSHHYGIQLLKNFATL